jgi:hypothetical protein
MHPLRNWSCGDSMSQFSGASAAICRRVHLSDSRSVNAPFAHRAGVAIPLAKPGRDKESKGGLTVIRPPSAAPVQTPSNRQSTVRMPRSAHGPEPTALSGSRIGEATSIPAAARCARNSAPLTMQFQFQQKRRRRDYWSSPLKCKSHGEIWRRRRVASSLVRSQRKPAQRGDNVAAPKIHQGVRDLTTICPRRQ